MKYRIDIHYEKITNAVILCPLSCGYCPCMTACIKWMFRLCPQFVVC